MDNLEPDLKANITLHNLEGKPCPKLHEGM